MLGKFQFTEENTFCISLESHVERRKQIKEKLHRENLEYTLWVASTPSNLIDNFDEDLQPLQKACAQSHINIWKHIINNDIQYALVIEDDICFDKNWKNKLNNFYKDTTSNDWDLILLNSSEPERILNTWVNTKNQYLTGGYIISINGIKKILKEWNGIYPSADWMTRCLQEHNKSYTYFPWLMIQEGKDSTINGNYEEDHIKVKSCLSKINYSLNNYNMKKIKVMAVTGFIPNAFPANHLSVQQCVDLGNRLKQSIPENIVAFDEGWELKDCWAHKFLENNPNLMPTDVNPPINRYKEPQHAALSNIVLLQRYEWMRLAAEKYPDVDVFAWIEYTVFKQRNITEEVIKNFISTLENKYYDEISLPGCWDKQPINDSYAHWRFVGSCWVCPSQHAENVAKAIKTVATLRTEMTGKISWDMNTMAYTELLEILPIRWYSANHDETQFTNF